jgi:multidrug resistance efflux pump
MKSKTQKTVKKETGTEMLARLMVNGFEQLRQEFKQGQEELRQEFKQGQAKLEGGQEEMKEEISSLKEEQKVQGRQITSIERKLEGTLLSLDETVHRSEFTGLAHRVEVLEK